MHEGCGNLCFAAFCCIFGRKKGAVLDMNLAAVSIGNARRNNRKNVRTFYQKIHGIFLLLLLTWSGFWYIIET